MVRNFAVVSLIFWLFQVAWLVWAVYAVAISDRVHGRTVVGRPRMAAAPNVVPMRPRPRAAEVVATPDRREDRAA